MTIELKPHERLDRLERENIDIIQSSEEIGRAHV